MEKESSKRGGGKRRGRREGRSKEITSLRHVYLSVSGIPGGVFLSFVIGLYRDHLFAKFKRLSLRDEYEIAGVSFI